MPLDQAWSRPASANPPRLGFSAALVVSAEPGLVAAFVDELPDALLAALIVIGVRGFLRAHEIVLGIVVGHFSDAPDGVLGRLQGDGVLLQQGLCNLGDAPFQFAKRQAFIDQLPCGGLLSIDQLAGQRVIHGIAHRQQVDHHLVAPPPARCPN